MNKSTLYLAGVAVLLLGVVTIWNGGFQSPNIPEERIGTAKQATRLSPEDEKKVFNVPTSTSTKEERADFAKFVDSLSQEITPIDVTECNILPQISKMSLGDELRFINKGDNVVYILIAPKKEKADAIEVPAKQEYTTSSVKRLEETGWYKYRCIKMIAKGSEQVIYQGMFVVQPPLNEDGELEPINP